MKRLIFLIWLLMPVLASANNSNVVIGDTAYFNYRHSFAIDSAQLILMRGAVNDTFSLMPIVGATHKLCEWEGVFNQVDSAGTYQVWIEPYTSLAIRDTILGVCQVELALRETNVMQISDDATAANNLETMLDGTGGQTFSLGKMKIAGVNGVSGSFEISNATGPGIYWYSSGNYAGAHIFSLGTGANADGLRLVAGSGGSDLDATLNLDDVSGQRDSNEYADDYWTAIQNVAGGLTVEEAAQLDSLITAVWTGGDSDSSAIVLLDSILASLGYDTDDLHTKVDAISVGAGSGVNVCSLWVYDTGNTVMVSDIMVQAENASGANQGRDRTNTTGISILNLNDGDYYLRIPMNSGYIQTTNPQPFIVSGATNDTIEVTLFTPTAPPGDLCTVYNWVKDGNDDPIKGVRVTASIPQGFWPVRYSGQAIIARHEVSTDSTGKWELPIFPSVILLTAQGDSASYWNIKAYKGSEEIFTHKVTVPDSTTFKMVPDAD